MVVLTGWDFKSLLPKIRLNIIRQNLENLLLLVRQPLNIFRDVKNIKDQMSL